MSESLALDASFSADRADAFRADPTSRIVQNAVTGTDADTVSLDRDVLNGIDETTSERLDAWKVANQKHSGRCWEFAGLNVLRAKVMKQLSLEDFEFSQNYIAFFDKIEKVNHILARAIATADRPLEDEQVRNLLEDGVGDGGYWIQFVDIVVKYGLVPQWAMPDTESAGNTDQMNRALDTIVRRTIGLLRAAATDSDPAEASRRTEEVRRQGLEDAWRVLAIHLGTPPQRFTWQYRDKDKNFHRVGEFTPLEFASQVVTENLREYVSVVDDPRAEHPVGHGYVLEHTPWMEGGTPYSFVTAKVDEIKSLAIESIRAGEPVWFSCDVKKQFDRKLGVWDVKLHDYDSLYGVDLGISKADRMRLHHSGPTHAMTFVGVDLVDGRPVRWRVENSWGDEVGTKGFFTMNDSWFDEYVFEVIVPKSRLTADQQAALDGELTVIPEWDVL